MMRNKFPTIHNFTDDEIHTIKSNYDSGMTLKEIGLIFNCSSSNIRHVILRNGGKTRPNGHHIKGKKNWNWKGGRINMRGYVGILNPTHPRADLHGYVLEHILVWEKAHNKRLRKGFIVHHLNGIKNDNRIENLVAMKRGEHIHQINPYVKRIKELEDKIKELSQPVIKFNFKEDKCIPNGMVLVPYKSMPYA